MTLCPEGKRMKPLSIDGQCDWAECAGSGSEWHFE